MVSFLSKASSLLLRSCQNPKPNRNLRCLLSILSSPTPSSSVASSHARRWIPRQGAAFREISRWREFCSREFCSSAAEESQAKNLDGMTVDDIVAKEWTVLEEDASDWKSHAAAIALSIQLVKKRMQVALLSHYRLYYSPFAIIDCFCVVWRMNWNFIFLYP